MYKNLFTIFLIVSFINAEMIDINNCSIEDLKKLDLKKEKLNSIWNYVSQNNVQNIFDLLEIENINSEDIHQIKKYIFINSSDKNNNSSAFTYKVDRWLAAEGNSEGMSEIWLDRFFSPKNPNNMTFDQLSSLPNLSPMDVVAVLKQQERGSINGTWQLKNSPGISYYGYKNLLDFVSFDEKIKPWNFRFNSLVRNMPSTDNFDEDDAPIQYMNYSNYETFYRFNYNHNFSNFNLSSGHLRYNDYGDLDNVYTNKFFLAFEDIVFDDPLNLKLDYIILGNYNVSYGQGLVFETGDSYQPRRTGHNYTKRINGIYPDQTRSQQYVMDGLAAQLSNDYFRLSAFSSMNKRDAVLNSDGSFTSLITMTPRLGWGWTNNPNNEKIYGNMLDAVTEITYGFNARVTPLTGTNFGITWYESLYDKTLDPQIINSIVGSSDDEEPQFDELSDYDDYSGDAFYLNYPQSNSCDTEIAAMYGSQATSSLWNDAKSARQVQGFEFSTVINKVSFQFEYGEMNENISEILKFNHNKPSALIFNIFFQTDNLNFIILHRDYDLDFDNPYQRSYSAYRRYKSSIFEDIYWLEDPMFYHLYSSNPQPQAEKGTYLEARYQFHERFVAGLQFDTWNRKADNAKYFRIVSKLEWRPLFNYRVYFRYKLQARGEFDLHHPSPYFTREARLRFKLRLSNYDNMELLYSWNYTTFSPRPRLTGSADAFAPEMDIGDIGSPDESIGFSYEHNYSEKMSIRGGIVYASGFLWYIEDNDFRLFNTDSAIFHSWLSFKYKPLPLLTLNFKVSGSSDYPTTTIVNGINSNGQVIETPFVHEQQFNFRIQVDYAI